MFGHSGVVDCQVDMLLVMIYNVEGQDLVDTRQQLERKDRNSSREIHMAKKVEHQ